MDHDHSNSTHSTNHLWIMLACCLIPIVGIWAIGAFGLSLGGLQSLLPYAVALLCPLMMIFMMRGMGHDQGNAPTPTSNRNLRGTEQDKASATQERCH